MDSDKGKLFVGGLAWDVNEDKLRGYFSHYGEVTHAMIMRDRVSNLSRGFGFVVFSDPSIVDTILQEKHTIDGRPVEAKKALPRAQQQSLRSRLPHASEDTRVEGNIKTRKIFVGGLPSSLIEEEFCEYFQNYGNVTDKVIMFDSNTGRPRGFGFITFDSEDAVDKVLQKTFHELKNKLVEVKRALPKEANPAGNSHGGSCYPGYDSSGPIRFLQPAFCGYSPYNSYGVLNYGYGYDPYSCYGGAAGVYMNPSLASIGYASSLGGVTTNQWSCQNHLGYGDFYNLNASYGASNSWGASANRGAALASCSTSQGHASQNGNQGNSYSICVENEGFFTNSDGNETGYRHTGSGPNSSSSEASTQAGQHEANGRNTTAVFDSSNGSPDAVSVTNK